MKTTDQRVGWIKTKLSMQVSLVPGHIVSDGNPALPKGAQQMAGWIKKPLCIELGLGPGDFVLDRDPAAPLPNGQDVSRTYLSRTATLRTDVSRPSYTKEFSCT